MNSIWLYMPQKLICVCIFFVKVRLTMISRMAKPEEVGMES